MCTYPSIDLGTQLKIKQVLDRNKYLMQKLSLCNYCNAKANVRCLWLSPCLRVYLSAATLPPLLGNFVACTCETVMLVLKATNTRMVLQDPLNRLFHTQQWTLGALCCSPSIARGILSYLEGVGVSLGRCCHLLGIVMLSNIQGIWCY